MFSLERKMNYQLSITIFIITYLYHENSKKNFLSIGHLISTSSNYQIIVQQLHNNLRPTRYLRTKFLVNSRRIKNASEQYDLRLITTWQFLQICSHVTGAYELRQRNWALRDDADPGPGGRFLNLVRKITHETFSVLLCRTTSEMLFLNSTRHNMIVKRNYFVTHEIFFT